MRPLRQLNRKLGEGEGVVEQVQGVPSKLNDINDIT